MSRRLKAAVMLTAALMLAFSGVAADAAVIDGVPPAKASSGSSSPRYHLRCWQDGKLIFEQSVATLPADAGRSTRLQSKDGAQEPVIVYETRNATCMARSLRVAR